MAARNRWFIHDASTLASSASLNIFSTVGFGSGGKRLVIVHGFYWGTATTMASTDYFRLVADGTTILQDPVGARFSGGESGHLETGLGITATSRLSAGFSAASGDGGLQSFFCWGIYE